MRPYSVGHRSYSMGHHAAPNLRRGRATLRRLAVASRRLEELSQNSDDAPAQAAALFHCAWLRWAWIRASKAERGLIPSSTVPIPWDTTPPLASGATEPPSRGRRRPPSGSKSFRKILTMPSHRPRPYSTVPGHCGHESRARLYSIRHRSDSMGHHATPDSGEAEPPSRSWRRPLGGSKSFRKILMMPPH